MKQNTFFKNSIIEFFIKILPFLFVSSVFFIGGIVLLYLKIPGWSIFLGLPAVQMGIVALIFALEKISSQKSTLPSKEYHYVDCLICKHQVLVPKYREKVICDDCQVKLAQNFKKSLAVLYLVLFIPLGLFLINKKRQIRTSMVYFFEPKSACEQGIWYPDQCRCGSWMREGCLEDQKARLCEGKLYFCYEKKDSVWFCKLKDY